MGPATAVAEAVAVLMAVASQKGVKLHLVELAVSMCSCGAMMRLAALTLPPGIVGPQGSIPYVPWLRAPYYVWIGRHPTVGRKWGYVWEGARMGPACMLASLSDVVYSLRRKH